MLLDRNFDFLPIWDSGGPQKRSKIQICSSFKLGISFLQGLLVYPRAKILLNWILDFGPRLRFIAQNVPKMAQKLKIELLRLFFSWGSHFFSIYSPS